MKPTSRIAQVLLGGGLLTDGIAKVSGNLPATLTLSWLMVRPDLVAPWIGLFGVGEIVLALGLLVLSLETARRPAPVAVVLGAGVFTVLSGGYLAMAPALDLYMDGLLVALAALVLAGPLAVRAMPPAGRRLAELASGHRRVAIRHRHAA